MRANRERLPLTRLQIGVTRKTRICLVSDLKETPRHGITVKSLNVTSRILLGEEKRAGHALSDCVSIQHIKVLNVKRELVVSLFVQSPRHLDRHPLRLL